MQKVDIQPETPDHYDQIWQLNLAAFEGETEGTIVNDIRASGRQFISLVALKNREVIGHLFLSAGEVIDQPDAPALIALGPLAVAPAYQRQGVGGQLMTAGLEKCRQAGYAGVFLIGHPSYYPKFGFAPGSTFDLKSEYNVPDEVFMVCELRSGVLSGISGTVKYHDAFPK